jgi:uncharacterized membrane protein
MSTSNTTGPPDDPRHAAEAASEGAIQGMETIASIRARAERGINRHQRAIEALTASLGRPRTLYAVVALAATWVAGNLALRALTGQPAPDQPPFFWLQGGMAFFALVMTTLVLITENRQTRHAEERAHLDLQVNLLTEQKVAKLIALVEELRRDLPMVRNRIDREAESMQQSVDPQAVLAELEKTVEGADAGAAEEVAGDRAATEKEEAAAAEEASEDPPGAAANAVRKARDDQSAA